MKEKIVPYGTTHSVMVIQPSPTEAMLVVASTDLEPQEGFMIINHGVKPLPKINDLGTIEFVKGGPWKGYWKFTANEK